MALAMKATGKMTWLMAEVALYIQMVTSMKESGLMTRHMVRECIYTWMERGIKAIGSTINSTVKEMRLGPMVLSMRASMSQERKKVSACFDGKISLVTWARSSTIIYTVKEPTRGATAVNMWAIGNVTRCTVWERLHGEMAESTPENIVTTKNMGTASSPGLTDAIIRENGKMENKTAWASTLLCKESKKWANGATVSASDGS